MDKQQQNKNSVNLKNVKIELNKNGSRIQYKKKIEKKWRTNVKNTNLRSHFVDKELQKEIKDLLKKMKRVYKLSNITSDLRGFFGNLGLKIKKKIYWLFGILEVSKICSAKRVV